MTERSSRRDSLASHTVLVAGALGIAQIAAYAVSVVAARALGPDGFGILAALNVAFSQGVELAGNDRLIIQHKVSLIQLLPQRKPRCHAS